MADVLKLFDPMAMVKPKTEADVRLLLEEVNRELDSVMALLTEAFDQEPRND